MVSAASPASVRPGGVAPLREELAPLKLDYGSKPFLAAPTLLSGPVGADGVLLSAGALGIIEVEAVLPVCVKPVCPA